MFISCENIFRFVIALSDWIMFPTTRGSSSVWKQSALAMDMWASPKAHAVAHHVDLAHTAFAGPAVRIVSPCTDLVQGIRTLAVFVSDDCLLQCGSQQ